MSKSRIAFICMLMISVCGAVEFISNTQVNHSRQTGKTDGAILIGGLFPVHSHNEYIKVQPCGILNHERGIHRLEAMFHAVDMINKDKTILPNITIGVDIRDTCGQDTHALEESVHFFNGKLDQGGQCPDNKKDKNTLAVIGAASSDVSIAVANLMRLFRVPQVSYASTSPDLNDRQRYAYFLRTVPPDTYQARAIVDIISYFNWTSVHGIYSAGNYGLKGMQKFRLHARNKGICVISASQVTGKSNFYGLLKSLTTFKNTKVVVLFLTTEHIQMLLRAALKINFDFKWLASEYWGTRTRFLNDANLQNAAEGAITLTLQTKKIQGFIDYFRSLNVDTNKRDPWFRKFWEETFACTFSDKPSIVAEGKLCNGTEILPRNYSFDDKIPYVIDAVSAVAKGIHNIVSEKCHKSVDCGVFLTGEMVLKSLKNVSYNGTLGQVKFDENGSTVRVYEIMEIVNGQYIQIGKWNKNLSKLTTLKRTTKSYCASSCISGEIKVPRKGLICCYDCHACGKDKYVTGDNQCSNCPANYQPNETKNGCESLTIRHINHVWVIIITSISGIGIIFTFAITFIFIYYNNTAVVKASGRDLSYPLLFGILLCYSLPYVILANPSTATCGLSRFGLGFSFCICYTAIAIKTNRIERIYKTHNVTKKEMQRITNPSNNLLIMLFVILIQALLAIVGLFVEKPGFETKKINGEVMLVCKMPQYDTAVSYIYNIVLILVCTIYAFRTRKFPASFNEAKCIGFVMYTTCIIWFAIIPVYVGLSIDYRFIAICMNISLSATSILAGVFAPKIYIAIFRPARNIRSRSGNSIHHVYSNQSFEEDACASVRKMTTLTEVDVEIIEPQSADHCCSKDSSS